jgi:hypothetical protein
MLALGSDAALKAAAIKDLRGANSADEQAAIGDAWWDLAEAKQGEERGTLRLRAGFWYLQAEPKLAEGLTGLKIRQRLDELKKGGGEIPRTSHDATAVKTPARATFRRNRNEPDERGWIVIFCSHDPSIWDTDTDRGARDFAIPVAKVPADIGYLRMAASPRQFVIIAVTKDKLSAVSVSTSGNFGWNGTKPLNWNAYALGIYNKAWFNKHGTVSTWYSGPGAGYSGWGFGPRAWIDDRQGYVWAGQEVAPTVLQISVKSDALSPSESPALLR